MESEWLQIFQDYCYKNHIKNLKKITLQRNGSWHNTAIIYPKLMS